MTDTHIKIKPVKPKVQYIGNGSTTVFSYSFAIFDDSDMEVYFGSTQQTSGFTITGAGQTDGGNVTFATAPEDGTIITLVRNVPIERLTDFQEGGTFRPKNLNDEFDRQTAFIQQVDEELSRCVKVGVTSDVDPSVILPQIERLYDSADNMDAIADDLTNINAVADDLTNIDAVANDLTNIDAVANDLTNIDAVAGDLTNIDIVATNISDVNNCATNMAAILDAPNQASAAADSATAAAQSASVFNTKLNIDMSNATLPYVTSQYHSGTDWYRVWSDGTIEQGGYIGSNTTVTFLKPYTTTNYNILLTDKGYQNNGSEKTLISSFDETTMSLYSQAQTGCFWRCCGK